MSKPEVRTFQVEELRVAREAERPKLVGYAAVFDSWTQIGRFREVIRPGAFRRAIKEQQDVRALLNHDANQVIGRTKNGSLRMAEDKRGLKVEIEPPDTQVGRDTVRMVEDGYLDAMSFAFRVPGQSSERWSPDDRERELLDLDLFDVSVVTYPAYKDTSIAARSLEAALAASKRERRLREMESKMAAFEARHKG